MAAGLPIVARQFVAPTSREDDGIFEGIWAFHIAVCTENLIRVDEVPESP